MPDIPYRTSCSDCEFNGKCLLDRNKRMIKKKCYIDTISEKLKIKPITVVDMCNSFIAKYGIEDFSFIDTIGKSYWMEMSNSKRKNDIKYNLEYWALRDKIAVTTNDIEICLAVANCYFSAWRDEEYITCANCGKIIKNSKQRNRKYCDKCKSNHNFKDTELIIKKCIDCGCRFEAWHNREVRCIECQIKANKASARERARRYRERKRNGLASKS